MNKPLILNYAVSCVGDNKKVFEYSYIKDMSIVKQKNKEEIFIDMDKKINELVTLTRVKKESDDEGFSLLEIITKTAVKCESDDEEELPDFIL